MQQIPLDFAVDVEPSLDNFVPGANAEVLGAVRSLAEGVGAERCMCLWGPPGSGRTHLLRAAVAHARAAGSGGVLAGGVLPNEEELAAGALLAVDDIELLDAAGQAALFSLLNAAARSALRLLLAAGNAPVALTLREDVRTRVALGLVLQVRALSDEHKREALAAHARARSFDLPAEVIDYLLVHGQRDLPSLMRMLDAADRFSLQAKRPVSLVLMREVLERARQAR